MKLLISLPLLLACALNAAETPSRTDRAQRDRKSMRGPDRLKVGDEAPAFQLKSTDGKREVALRSFTGKRPVVLVFGSYT